MTLTEQALRQIREMLFALKPVFGETIITHPEAPLPKALPQTLGMNMIDGMMLALAGEDAALQRACAFEIWNCLPDDEIIHKYKGFYRICDILEEEEEELFVKEMEEIDEEFRHRRLAP